LQPLLRALCEWRQRHAAERNELNRVAPCAWRRSCRRSRLPSVAPPDGRTRPSLLARPLPCHAI